MKVEVTLVGRSGMIVDLKLRPPVEDRLRWNESVVEAVELRLSESWVEVEPNLRRGWQAGLYTPRLGGSCPPGQLPTHRPRRPLCYFGSECSWGLLG